MTTKPTKGKRIEKIKIPKKYCYNCGSLMIGILWRTVYDTDTGKPDHLWIYRCPKNEGKVFKHDTEPPYQDY